VPEMQLSRDEGTLCTLTDCSRASTSDGRATPLIHAASYKRSMACASLLGSQLGCVHANPASCPCILSVSSAHYLAALLRHCLHGHCSRSCRACGLLSSCLGCICLPLPLCALRPAALTMHLFSPQ